MFNDFWESENFQPLIWKENNVILIFLKKIIILSLVNAIMLS